MASAEQVQLMVNKVRYKKRDGTLYLMGERLAWCPESRNQFEVSIPFADMKCQKVSPDGKTKVQLQVILLTGESNVFHFAYSDNATALSKREGVKNLLAQMLPKFRRQIDKELEEKNRLLQMDPELFQTYKDLVVSGIITPEEFWTSHSGKLSVGSGAVQKVGVSASFLADVKPQADGCNGLRYNLTYDTIQSIFVTYPAVKKKYLEKVPDKLSEKEFWTMFFQSHYFHRDRVNQGGSSKDIFADCVKKDDQDILALLRRGVRDVFNDLTYFDDDDSARDEGYGTNVDRTLLTKGKQSSTQLINKNIIKRFNHQNAMVLSSSNRTEISENSVGTSAEDGEPLSKKVKLKEATTYSDLVESDTRPAQSLHLHRSERYSHGPTIVKQVHQELNGQKVREGMEIVLSQCRNYKPRLAQTMDSGGAAAALCDLSPDANNANQVQTNIVQRTLPPPQQESLKQLYMSAIELCRHFWFCFPANSTFLQEKVVRMCKSIETFHQTRVRTFQEELRRNMVHANVTEHLEDMFNAVYNKFHNWQSKKIRR